MGSVERWFIDLSTSLLFSMVDIDTCVILMLRPFTHSSSEGSILKEALSVHMTDFTVVPFVKHEKFEEGVLQYGFTIQSCY